MSQKTQQLKDDAYYDAMESLYDGPDNEEKALLLLNLALEIDKDYVQTYIGLVSVYGALGDQKKVQEMIEIAYKKTLKKFPKWPEEMLWGHIENRAYMRALQYRADIYWDEGKNDQAIKLFRLLLKLNPNDNQGVRYEIAGLYAGLKGPDVNKMTAEGNEKQDWSKRENLLKEQNKKHKFWKAPQY